MKKYALCLIGFYLLCYILPIGSWDLMIPDETRYAEIPREMITNGEWVVPHLDGFRYFEKPVLGYWIHAAGILALGENAFSVRLPSAIAAGLSALLIFLLVSRTNSQKENNNNGILAAIIFLTCFGVMGISNIAILDNIFSFFLSYCIAAFYLASEENKGSKRETLYLISSGVFCGLAFLTKGFLAVVLPALVICAYLIWQQRFRDLLRMSWLPALFAVIVSLPWAIAIHLKAPDFWRFFIFHEHIRRFMGNNAQHGEPFWFFFMAAPGMALPWTLMIPAAVSRTWQGAVAQTPLGRLIRFSICWLILPFLFFSISKGKLLTYILPCFPPFAILITIGIINRIFLERDKNVNRCLVGAGVVFGGILLALIYILIFSYKGVYPYSHPWKALMAVNSLICFILLCVLSYKSASLHDKLLLFGMAPFLIFLSSHFLLPDKTVEEKMPGILLASHLKDIEPQTIVIADSEIVRAACWYFKRDNVYILGAEDEFTYGLSLPGNRNRLLNPEAAARLIAEHPGGAVVVASSKHMKRWQDHLPAPVFEDNSGPNGYYFLRY